MRGGTGGWKEGQWSFFSETLQTCPNLFNFEEGWSSKVVLIPSWHIRKSDVLDRIECNSLGPRRGILRMPPMKLKHTLLFKFCEFFRDVLVHGIVSMYVPSNNCTPGFDVIVSYSARLVILSSPWWWRRTPRVRTLNMRGFWWADAVENMQYFLPNL